MELQPTLCDVYGHTVVGQSTVVDAGTTGLVLYAAGTALCAVSKGVSAEPFVLYRFKNAAITSMKLRGSECLAVGLADGSVVILSISLGEHLGGGGGCSVTDAQWLLKGSASRPRHQDPYAQQAGPSADSNLPLPISLTFAGKLLIVGSTASSTPLGGPVKSFIQVWDLSQSQVKWQKTFEDPHTSLVSLETLDFGFISVHRTEVRRWSLSNTVSNGTIDFHCTVFNTVKEFQGIQFVGAAVHSPRSEIYALTSAGFLVAYKHDGSVDRWMDCKVCPATSLLLNPSHVVVMGNVTRLFSSSEWEFALRLKHDSKVSTHLSASYLSSLSASCSVAGATIDRNLLLFYADGDMLRCAFSGDPSGSSSASPSPGKKAETDIEIHISAVGVVGVLPQIHWPWQRGRQERHRRDGREAPLTVPVSSVAVVLVVVGSSPSSVSSSTARW